VTADAGLAARTAALDVLDAVLRRRRPLDEALAETQSLDGLEPRDRGFARVLVAGVLRRLRVIDAVIDRCLNGRGHCCGSVPFSCSTLARQPTQPSTVQSRSRRRAGLVG
jgi:hypothetical protein